MNNWAQDVASEIALGKLKNAINIAIGSMSQSHEFSAEMIVLSMEVYDIEKDEISGKISSVEKRRLRKVIARRVLDALDSFGFNYQCLGD